VGRIGAWRLLFTATLALVLRSALRPNHPGPDWFEHADKLRHAAAFGVLWLLGRRAGVPATRLAAGLAGFGLLIEGLQSLTPDRDASLADLLADLAGLSAAAAATRRS
jgi:VanZ family protein